MTATAPPVQPAVKVSRLRKAFSEKVVLDGTHLEVATVTSPVVPR
jgi:hypothetical protein